MDMSSVLGNLFSFRSKEEKARIYEAYSKRIFPYGEEQKERIAEILAELFPKHNPNYVLMHYILIKEGMTGESPLDFNAAVKKVKGSPLRKTAELEPGMHALLKVDLFIDENLNYPTLEELRAAINDILLEQ
jgi:hypothetical protein